MNCWICSQPIIEGKKHSCPSGSYGELKMSRQLWDLMLLRLEAIARASDMPWDEGTELTASQRIECFERALTLLDVDDIQLRIWLETGRRR